MEHIDLMVLKKACEWLEDGKKVMLATVVRTWGSSPRPIGAMMALREDGRSVGSVSGGCIEDDLVHKYTDVGGAAFPRLPTRIVTYGVSADEAHKFGLPCGGTLELVLEFNSSLEPLQRLVGMLLKGELVRRIVSLSDGLATIEPASVPESLKFDGQVLQNVLGPGYRMLIIGAGALAEYLSTMALFNGFSVTICDPRIQYIGIWDNPEVSVNTQMPDDAVLSFSPDQRSCIVALSHDPKLDDLALLQALHTPAFYVGAIGSRRNNDSRRARLIEHFGETHESLQRLKGPIGIFIGSKTPAEIAVSVMAEILAVRNGFKLPIGSSVANAKKQIDASLQFSINRMDRSPSLNETVILEHLNKGRNH